MSDRTEGTFLVTAADEDSAVLRDAADGQVHTLSTNPDLAVHDAVEAVLEPEPPMGVTWRPVEIRARRSLSLVESDQSPTAETRRIAAGQPTGELTRRERAGDGEWHVITVPEDETEAAVADVLDDEATLTRAARLGVERVEVRSAPGVVSVRYLP